MARMARVVVPKYPHHITQRGVRSLNIFSSDEDRIEYLRLMREQCDRFGLHVISYCLMDNHVHFVAVPEREESLARAIGEAHRLYTRMVNFRDGVRGFLFQGRFFSCPLDEKYLLACIRYVERNPVRVQAGIRHPWDYHWSSARYRLGLEDSDPLLEVRGRESKYSQVLESGLNWRTLLSKEEDDDDVRALLKRTRTGRPCGSESFVERLEKLTGRTLKPQKPGPKTEEDSKAARGPRRSKIADPRSKRARK
jgi:putative transposase